ncbi:MAG TPA: type II toxin-antitoxin system RelE/ParE family toxin [Allosphingosinicella sp.]|nr:type II toxin-antitoxin system RelE/ParE family toxin [Allosphingosinicella sp.]
MSRYLLSPRARADLDEIWNYTADRWDEEQAENYLRSIEKAMATIAKSPQRGRSYDEVRVGYRRFRIGSHILIYRLIEKQVHIVRILHVSMDVDRHL